MAVEPEGTGEAAAPGGQPAPGFDHADHAGHDHLDPGEPDGVDPDGVDPGPGDRLGRAPAPGRGVAFDIERRSGPLYWVARFLFVHGLLQLWFRPQVTGRRHLPADGPIILAPSHRSFADFGFTAFLTERKIFFMAKDDLWRNPRFGTFLTNLGVFPVHREAPDRESMRRAEEVLRQGQVLVVFPEGTRQSGPLITELHEGAAFLSARTGAPIVPIGIGNTDRAMPKGSRIPKPLRVQVVVGEPIEAPARSSAGRVARSQVRATTEELARQLQIVYDEARIRAGQ